MTVAAALALPVTKPTLRVVEQPAPRQDCARCPQLRKCWNLGSNPSDSALAINLLVCRLKLGIDTNRTTKTLLRLLRPKVIKTAQWMHRTIGPSSPNIDELVGEIETAVVMYLLQHYEMGEVAWPLHYLFAYPSGVIRGWAMNFTNKVRRYSQIHQSYGLADDPGYDLEAKVAMQNARVTSQKVQSTPMSATYIDDEALDRRAEHSVIDRGVAAADDGVTLSLSEFRVMRFCMTNADTEHARSPVSGLHTWLANHTNVKRSTVTKYYRQGGYRVVEAVGKTDEVLAARGVRARRINKARRTRWLHGATTSTDRLTADEIHGLLTEAQRENVTLNDVCWAYGVSQRGYSKLRDRFGGMTAAQIEEADGN